MKSPFDISSDGRWIAFGVYGENVDIWILDRESRDVRPLLASPFNESELRFSPNGEWVAYSSNESGQDEVYVLQFPQVLREVDRLARRR